MLPDLIVALIRKMPPAGAVWALEDRVTFLQALDASLCLEFGGKPQMIWLGEDGEIHIAPR